MSWLARVETIEPARVTRVRISHGEDRVTHRSVIDGWRHDPAFRSFYNATIAESPFAALYWELPPLDADTVSKAHECVLVRSPQLAGVHADPQPFAEHFGAGSAAAVAFANLGRDAMLVAPAPGEYSGESAHLASFTRCADTVRQQEFWRAVGDAMHVALSDRPLWLSTSGLGIYWLHARIDRRPKYYTYAPYRDPGFYCSAAGQP